MKKVLLFLLTIMLGLGTWQGSAQVIVDVIGDGGTSTNSYLPIYTLYNNTLSEQIYTADEIGMAGSISSIAFYNGGSEKSPNVKIYMINTTKTEFSSTTDWFTVTTSDLVFDGVVTFTAGAWTTITLDTPFDYDGASNFGLVVDGNLSWSSGLACRVFDGTSNCAMYVYSDPTDYDAVGATYTASSRLSVKNQIKLEIMPNGNNCYPPLSPAVSGITAYEATLSWTPRENQTQWEVFCGTGVIDLDQVSWTPVTDTFYTFTGLTPATNYTAYVRTVCGTEVSNPRQVSFATEATCPNVPTSVTVLSTTATTANVDWAAAPEDNAWEVVVVPANATPESGTPEQTTTKPYTVTNLQDNTQYKVYVRTDCGGGDHSYWSNPATFTTLPFCSAPVNVNVSQITANSALVTWQPAVFGANDYTVEYSYASEDNWTQVVVDGTQLMLSGLVPDSTYNVRIFSNCSIGTGDTIYKDFTTRHCLVGGDLQIGDGTSTTAYFPTYSCYNYSYAQQIFLASEMNGAANINSIAFDVNSIQSSSRHISIYLMHTTAASSDWLTPTTAQLVYNGTVNLVVGWNTLNFTAPFQYNGTDNLALIVLDSTGSYSCSNYFNCHTASATLSHCQYQDSGPYSINSLPSSGSSYTSSSRCNVIFGVDCDNDATCVRPNVYVTEVSPNSVTLDWAPGYSENTWEIEYSSDNATWTSAGTTSLHPYEVSGLNSDTRYYFRVRSNCGSDVSDWSGTNARTECGPITQLPYFNNFDEVISVDGTAFVTCWSRYTTNPERVVRCYGSATHSGSYALDFNYSPSCTTAAVTPMLDPSIPLNTVMLDFWAYSSLGQGWMEVGTMSDPNDFSTYEFYDTVRLSAASTWENLIIDFSNYTGNNQYIAFLEINGTSTSYIFDDFTINYSTNCFHPTNLAVDAVTNTTVTLSWTEAGSANAWDIEYGPVGFTPGTGTTVLADANPFTVDNLTPATAYDFYVSANCGGESSTPFGPVQATPGQYIMGTSGSDTLTTCGVIIYDNGGPNGNYSSSCDFTLVLYPENPSAMMALTGTSNTEGNDWDYIRIYDGVGTSGTQLAYHTGQNQTVNVISQSGPLTLVFHSDGSNQYSGIALTASCVTCYPPTNITASNPTLDGATLTWHGSGDSYVLFLNGDMTTGYDANDTTYTFIGLNPSSSYSVQIAAICNGDTSMLSSAATFATGCGAITITADNPWVEDFESYAGSGVQQFICWATPVTEVVDNGTAPFVYCNYGQAAHSGTNTAEMKGSVNMLALPEFTNNLSDLRVSFWATGYSYTNTNVEIGYITDINDPTTFVPVFANAGVPGARGGSGGGNGNYMGPFSFGGVTASGARIALRYTGPGSSSGWNVDDFIVEIAPDCQSPVKTSVTATNIGGHVATISWVDNDPSHSAWTVYYKETAGNDWSTAPAFDTSVVLTGLDPQTQYDVYVITDCGTPETNPDATHTIHFTTTVACPAPTGLTLASVSTDEATITWNGTASSYNVEYGETGFTPGTGTVNVALTESFTLTNLTPSTSYTIYVNSDCTDNNDSLSSTVSFSFSTTQVPAALPYTADFTVSSEWLLNNGTCSNNWITGTVNNVPSLFVTNDGTTPSYSISSSSTVTAEKLLAVGDNASVIISFDVNAGGESSWDYLKVFFAPAENNYPASTSAPDFASYSYSTYALDFGSYLPQTGYSSYPYKLNLTQGNTIHVTAEMPNPNENATSTSTAKLVFVWKNDGSGGTQPAATISNVSVIVNSCPIPTNLTVSNITTTSADIAWTPGDSETAWNLEYKEASDTTWTTIAVSGTPSYQLANLNTGTSYNIRLQADCSADDQSMWVDGNFATACDAISVLPYSEDFNSYTGSTYTDNNGIAPDCWVTASNNSTYGAPHIIGSGSYHYASSGNSMVFTCGSAGADAYAALPTFTAALNTLHLNFWRAMESTSSGTLSVGYVTNLADLAGSFVQVATIPSVSSSNGDTISVDFNGADIPAVGNICFHWNYSSSYYSCCIDDITVSDAGSGPVITNPTVATTAATGVQQTTATLNGTITNPDGVTITAKGFEWKATAGGTYTPVTVTGDNLTYNLTGLTAGTGYTYKAFITYNGATVYGSEMTFTTLPEDIPTPCNVPTGLTVGTVTHESIAISWDNDANVNSWNIQYRPVGGTLASATSATNSYNITGLAPETEYQIQVQADCGDGNVSDWSAAVTATTTVGIENWLMNSISLYPNPAKEYIDVRVDELHVTGMEVYDVYGKLINTVSVIDNPTRINVSGLASGMYFVRVTTEQGVATKSFVKK